MDYPRRAVLCVPQTRPCHSVIKRPRSTETGGSAPEAETYPLEDLGELPWVFSDYPPGRADRAAEAPVQHGIVVRNL